MAISSTRQPLSLPLLAFFITIFLMLLDRAYSSDSISFSFINFDPTERNLILQGDAQILPSNVLQLTKTDSTGNPVKYNVGRVLHSAQVRLWDKNTNRVANFQTQFSFSLTSPFSGSADGIAFFIAPPETTVPAGWTGGTLGLFNTETALNTSANQVVAVEFDTFFGNSWDPKYQHIGIDVNSIGSSKVVRWERREGETVNVLITYNPATQTLGVIATYPDGQRYELSHVVDLRTVLPEWVRVGFSAASGEQVQIHSVGSWSFTSTLLYTAQKENEYLKLARDM